MVRIEEQRYEGPCPELFARVRDHDLKHTCGRRLRSAGVSLETRKLLLGHKNGDITTHYSVPEIAELLNVVQNICTAKGTPAITLLRVGLPTSKAIYPSHSYGTPNLSWSEGQYTVPSLRWFQLIIG
jgi:hypothetical protein